MFIVRNYHYGVSYKLNEKSESDQVFEVKGPMGKSLGIKQPGQYLCFCAGTGILAFMDLIA